MNKLDEIINNETPLIKIIGEKNYEKLQKEITDVIIERIKSDLDNFDMYVIDEQMIMEIFDESIKSAKSKLKKIYTEGALEIAQKQVEIYQKNLEKEISEINNQEVN